MMVSPETLREVPRVGPDWCLAESLKARIVQLRVARIPFYLTLEDLDLVLQYKLRRQYGRTKARRRHLADELVRVVTRAAFEAQSPDRLTQLRVRASVLSAMPGVGVPVASAVLALSEPLEYGIIDVRAWEQVFGTRKKSFATGIMRST